MSIKGCHSPLSFIRLEHEPLHPLTCNPPWKGFKVKISEEAHRGWKTDRTGPQIVTYFHKKISRSQILASSRT